MIEQHPYKPNDPNAVAKTCPKCMLDADTSSDACSRCGTALQKVSTLRVTGVVQVILGIFLMGVIAALSVVIFNVVRNGDDPSASTRFTGSGSDMLFIVAVFGIVFLVGLASFSAGAWQIIFGKRNKFITRAVLIFGLLFMLAGVLASFLS